MKRFVIIDPDTNLVANVVKSNVDQLNNPLAMESSVANIGDKWDGANFVPPARATYPKETLVRAAQARSLKKDAEGVSIALPDGRVVLADTDADGRADISGLIMMGTLGADIPLWHQSTGDLVLTLDDLKKVGAAVAEHRAAVVATLTMVLADIEAGHITTIAEIEALI